MKALAPLLAAATAACPALAQRCTWQPLGGPVRSDALALEIYDEDGPGGAAPELIAGGCISRVGERYLNRIVRWDGSQWTNLGGGVAGLGADCVLDMTVWDPDGSGPAHELLVAAGQFTFAGEVSANRVAAWDGERWQALGDGLNDWVLAVESLDHDGAGPAAPTLYAAGFFTRSGGTSVLGVARWTGINWEPLGAGIDGVATHLRSFDDDGTGPALYVGGLFEHAGGISTPNLARWTGEAWEATGGASETIEALEMWDPDGPGPMRERLVAAGDLQRVGGVAVSGIAAFDGLSWSDLGGGVSRWLGAAASFPLDPAEPHQRHLVAGEVSLAPALHVWDGEAWNEEPLAPFISSVSAFASFDLDGDGVEELIAGGLMAALPGGGTSAVIYRDCGSACRADLDGDGELTFFDFLRFQDLFAAGDPRADWDGDGVLTFFDFLGFQNDFAAGCA